MRNVCFLVQGPRRDIMWFYLSCRSLSRNVCTNSGWCRTLSGQCGKRLECFLCDSVQFCSEFWKFKAKQQLNGEKWDVEHKPVAIETVLSANNHHCGLGIKNQLSGIKNQLSVCFNSLLGRVWCIWQADQWLPLTLRGWFLVLESTLNASSCTICAPLTRWLSECLCWIQTGIRLTW